METIPRTTVVQQQPSICSKRLPEKSTSLDRRKEPNAKRLRIGNSTASSAERHSREARHAKKRRQSHTSPSSYSSKTTRSEKLKVLSKKCIPQSVEPEDEICTNHFENVTEGPIRDTILAALNIVYYSSRSSSSSSFPSSLHSNTRRKSLDSRQREYTS